MKRLLLITSLLCSVTFGAFSQYGYAYHVDHSKHALYITQNAVNLDQYDDCSSYRSCFETAFQDGMASYGKLFPRAATVIMYACNNETACEEESFNYSLKEVQRRVDKVYSQYDDDSWTIYKIVL